MLGIPQAALDEIRHSNTTVDLTNPQHLRKYALHQLQQMRAGTAFGKAYSEFRNGFRHPFATSMAQPSNQPGLLEYARLIDKCLESISAD